MVYVIILYEYKSSINKPRSKWDHVMLQYAVIAGLIQFALYLVQITDFAVSKSPPPQHTHTHTHTITKLPPWFTVSVILGVKALSPFFSPQIWPKGFEFWFVSPKGLYSTALLSNLCAPWSSRAFWRFTFSAVVSWLQPCHIGLLHRVFSSQWMLTHFFHDIGLVVQWCL